MEFFPPNTLRGDPALHAFSEYWYAAHLVTMQESPRHPPVVNRPDIYRLLFLPIFRRPAVVRLSEADGVWKVVCKHNDGLGGYTSGSLASGAERDVTPTEALRFGRLLEGVAFWDMPSRTVPGLEKSDRRTCLAYILNLLARVHEAVVTCQSTSPRTRNSCQAA